MNDLPPLTIPAQQVLTLAGEEAYRLNHNQVEPEHLLLGLLKTPASRGGQLLQQLAVDRPAIRHEIEQTMSLATTGRAERPALGAQTRRVLERAAELAQTQGRAAVDTADLLLGLLSRDGGRAADLLRSAGVERTEIDRLTLTLPSEEVAQPALDAALGAPLEPTSIAAAAALIQPSPVFLLLLAFTGLTAYLAYSGTGATRIMVFLFVTGGWLISLSLHEFGHALVAYLGGDRSVVGKGYLTLNPLKYTHSFLSIVLPVLIVILGGIGLPGGAVYINEGAIRSRQMRSLTSAGGPLATLSCAVLLAVPFMLLGINAGNTGERAEFWAGLAFLAFLQITALVLNLLPLPGLDGFGIIAPFLPRGLLQSARRFGSLGFLLLLFLLLSDTPVNRIFWWTIARLSALVADPILVGQGWQVYRFWSG